MQPDCFGLQRNVLGCGDRATEIDARQNLPVALRLRIEKSLAFRKTDSGGWRCNTGALQPIELGVALNSNR